MGAQEALQNRNKSIIERRYIDDVLQETGDYIKESQNRLFGNFDFKSTPIRERRTFIVSNNKLQFTHLLKARFIDMRRLNGRNKKQYPIHNKPVIEFYNSMVNKLHFGLTQDVRNKISNQLNIEI